MAGSEHDDELADEHARFAADVGRSEDDDGDYVEPIPGTSLHSDYTVPGIEPEDQNPYGWHTGKKRPHGGEDAIEVIEGRVAVLDRHDVDTDQIMPKQFLKRTEKTGYGEFLFYDWFRSGRSSSRLIRSWWRAATSARARLASTPSGD